MTRLLTFLVLSLGLADAFAQTRRAVTLQLAVDLQRQGNLENLRVYLSRGIVTSYRRSTVADTDFSNGAYRRTIEADVLDEVVGSTIRGKILQLNYNYRENSLWVSFDPSCEETSCAYEFRHSGRQEYFLYRAPLLPGYVKQSVLSQGMFAKNPEVDLGHVGLQYLPSEETNTRRTTREARGF